MMAAAARGAAAPTRESKKRPINLLDEAKILLAKLVVGVVLAIAPDTPVAGTAAEIVKQIGRPTAASREGELARDLCLPCFALAKRVPGSNPKKLADDIAAYAKKHNSGEEEEARVCQDVSAANGYLNFTLAMTYLARVIPLVIDGSFTEPLAPTGIDDRTMIEYSQP